MNDEDKMTVGQLIEMLLGFDENDYVGFAYNSGNHAKSVIVDAPYDVAEDIVRWSSYTDSYVIDTEEYDKENREHWVVIHA